LKTTLMLVLLTVIWGGTFPATKTALSVTDPMQFVALRFGLAIGLVTPFLARLRRGSGTLWNAKLWRAGVGVGSLLFIGYALQTLGMKHTTASRSGFFTGLLVALTPSPPIFFAQPDASLSADLGADVPGGSLSDG
jgi:drug/metabolite transporter (DMT)-like permease